MLLLVELRVESGSVAQKERVIVLRVLRCCESPSCVAILGVPHLILHEFFC